MSVHPKHFGQINSKFSCSTSLQHRLSQRCLQFGFGLVTIIFSFTTTLISPILVRDGFLHMGYIYIVLYPKDFQSILIHFFLYYFHNLYKSFLSFIYFILIVYHKLSRIVKYLITSFIKSLINFFLSWFST